MRECIGQVLCVIPLVNTCPDKQHDTVISYLVFLGLKKNKAKGMRKNKHVMELTRINAQT